MKVKIIIGKLRNWLQKHGRLATMMMIILLIKKLWDLMIILIMNKEAIEIVAISKLKSKLSFLGYTIPEIGENDKITIFFYKICGAVPIRTAPLFYYPFSFFKFSYSC